MKESITPDWSEFMTQSEFENNFTEEPFRGKGWYPASSSNGDMMLVQETDYVSESSSSKDIIQKDHARNDDVHPVFRVSVWSFDVRKLFASLLA